MFLARKITRSKWEDRQDIGADEISADAVTADLRTHEKTLSFWRCGDGKHEVEDVVLAMASAGQRLDKIEVVWVADKVLRDAADQRLKSTNGRTPVADLVNQHVDLHGLDYARLGATAKCIVGALAKDQYRRLSKKEVKYILMKGIETKRLKPEDLKYPL